MKRVFLLLLPAIFVVTMAYSQQTYNDTLSTSIGQFILETNEQLPILSFSSESVNESDGGSSELVVAHGQGQRLAQPPKRFETTISLFPNPTSDLMTLNIFNAASEIKLEVTDISGRIQMIQAISSVNGSYVLNLDLSGYTSGLYFLKVHSSGQEYSVKIVRI